MLTAAEQRELRRAFGGIARDHRPDPNRQPHPIDWDDIRRVVDAACSEVFMAVAQVTRVSDDVRRYRLRTIDEKPAELIVIRIDEGLADYRAEAMVGLFDDETDRAAELVEAFEKELIELRDWRLAEIGR